MRISNFVLIGVLVGTSLLAQRDRWAKDRDDRGRMEMYAIWKLTESLDLDEKQAEIFFPKLNSHKIKMEEMGKERRDIWEDIVLKARKGEKVGDEELETARKKSKALDKKLIAEKDKFANGLGNVLTNEQQVLFHISNREIMTDVKERMRDHRKRGKDMDGYKKKRKRW